MLIKPAPSHAAANRKCITIQGMLALCDDAKDISRLKHETLNDRVWLSQLDNQDFSYTQYLNGLFAERLNTINLKDEHNDYH